MNTEHARKLERDAIVAWMRKQEADALKRAESTGELWDAGAHFALEPLADAVERGAHLEGGKQ